MAMAEAMFGGSIKIVSASYIGDPQSAGIYSDGLKVAPGVVPSDSGVILSTGKVTDFTNSSGATNQSASTSTNTKGADNDPDVNQIAGSATYDAAIFAADFVPQGSVLTMQVTFSSEEYLEYVGSGYNDTVGVWVNGKLAVLTVGDGEISIDNINPTHNGALYIDNARGLYNTEMDGFTVTLTLKAPVIAGRVNSIKIVLADGGDATYDSNLMIVGSSVQTAVVATADEFTVDMSGETLVDLTANDVEASGGKLTITKINGIPVTAGSVVTLASGLQITVNADGTITVISDPTDTPGTETFSYEVTNEQGVTDVGFVQGTLLPCFVAGSRIDTVRGPVPIEEIEVGDLVVTLHHGLQPVRWVGGRRVASMGAMAAVNIPADTLGQHGALRVSPQHRVYLSGWQAQLYCGVDEVLVKAIHLVRAGRLAQDQSGAPVVYHHLLFDQYQIICAEGLWSESYHPGAQTLAGHDAQARAELLALFPMLGLDPDGGYGPIAHPEARASVARLMM